MRFTRHRSRLGVVVVALAFVLLVAGCGAAGSGGGGADFPTRDITWVVPVQPGGGVDVFTRVVAEQMKKHLPQSVQILVKNVPGGELALGYTEVLNAKPDGYTVGTFLNGSISSQLLDPVTYDLGKVTWIGNIASVPQVLVVAGNSPYKSVDDLKKASETKVMKAPHTGGNNGAAVVISALTMGIKSRYVAHTGGLAEARTALLRGDGDYIVSAEAGVAGQLKSGEVRALAIYGTERSKTMPDVPTVVELGYPNLVGIGTLNYLLGAPLNLPEATAKVLRESFTKTMADPATIEALVKARAIPDYRDHDQSTRLMAENFDLYNKHLETLKKELR